MNSDSATPGTGIRERLDHLGRNLWWSWDQRLGDLLVRIDEPLWEHLRHNPTAFLRDVDDDKLDAPGLDASVAAIEDALGAYLGDARLCDEDTDLGLRYALSQLAPEVLR